MSQDILNKVLLRAQIASKRTDFSDVLSSSVFPRLSAKDLSDSVLELGFEPPALYVAMLQSIGNGGFGPGYGLMGLVGGATDDQGQTAVDLYKCFAEGDPDELTWKWPQGLLPVCHWGCAIYSCIDCVSADALVKTWDPNAWEEGTSPEGAIHSTGMSLADWLENWANGVNLWEKMFPAL
ncbi:hypothetical protein J7382_12325 [Shimia sp. R11_0]|uniref:hypothetical protein n=1 Tax=Shimia sp. R11_0 TaxID=2821096 RepID=UPI001ADCED8A|nr:hypothetical protein [Shimia sp. R11_0]MBO9478323.1 hypothetical protein [Shimia sp. R11_0]